MSGPEEPVHSQQIKSPLSYEKDHIYKFINRVLFTNLSQKHVVQKPDVALQ